MSDKYKFKLSDKEKKLFEAWNKMYPVTSWESERNQQISEIQGWGNPYIDTRSEG